MRNALSLPVAPFTTYSLLKADSDARRKIRWKCFSCAIPSTKKLWWHRGIVVSWLARRGCRRQGSRGGHRGEGVGPLPMRYRDYRGRARGQCGAQPVRPWEPYSLIFRKKSKKSV